MFQPIFFWIHFEFDSTRCYALHFYLTWYQFFDWVLLFKIFSSYFKFLLITQLCSSLCLVKDLQLWDKGMSGTSSRGTLLFRELLEISEENYEQQMLAAVSLFEFHSTTAINFIFIRCISLHINSNLWQLALFVTDLSFKFSQHSHHIISFFNVIVL